jgi:hypothetical protein
MSVRTAAFAWLAVLICASAGRAADKQAVRVERLGNVLQKNIFLAPSLATADTCFVSDNKEITTRIDGWVVGFELYKSLMNPEHQCENPYPFTVTAINMPMMFNTATPITVGVDIEAVDSTTVPGCTVPGALLALSSEWDAQVPAAGMYNIWVPLDTPFVVNGPFFAGFYIGNTFPPVVNPAVLTDDYPANCATYNIWDEQIGFVDMCNNDIWDFPGRLAMEVAGIPGGHGVPPVLEVLAPANGENLYGQSELWAWDKIRSGMVEYIMFEYSNGGPFVEIGRDFDGTSPLRNGVTAAVSGTGYNVNWDFSALPEGNYTLRVTLVDTLGDSTSLTRDVYLEPTPPVATITSPGNGSMFCVPVDIHMSSSDENLGYVEMKRRPASSLVTIGVNPVSQLTMGDADGDPSDSNRVSNGEYGDYYSGPAAAAMAAMVWAARGYPALARQGTNNLNVQQVAEALAAAFKTRINHGTFDEALWSGLRTYAEAKGGGFKFGYLRNPAYSDLRICTEDEERVVVLGLGGTPGLWVTVDGFVGWKRTDSAYSVSIANPLTGSIQSVSWRDRAGYSELSLSGQWHRVDIMVSVLATAWTVSRTAVGLDFSGADGWMVPWTQSGISDGSWHYLRSIGHDYDDYVGTMAVLAENNCAAMYVAGDYNDDRIPTVADLFLLIEFIARNGPPPSGGGARADCNCDNVVNVADIIYYMNYLYGTASAPCR